MEVVVHTLLKEEIGQPGGLSVITDAGPELFSKDLAAGFALCLCYPQLAEERLVHVIVGHGRYFDRELVQWTKAVPSSLRALHPEIEDGEWATILEFWRTD